MSARKRNEFLDAGDSDDDDFREHDSDDDFQKGGRSAKRRRVDDDDSDDGDDISDDEHEDQALESSNDEPSEQTDGKSGSGDEDRKEDEGQRAAKSKLEHPGTVKPLTKKNLVATEAAIRKSGVIYLSRIPPFMKPAKLRSLLEPYGKINRMFLAAEDPSAHSRRVRSGGNKKRSYTEGWVEFVRKKDAKKACDLLNAHTIGGKKSSWYRDDIWCMKYLKGFKWHNLTEQIAAENAERESRKRADLSRTRKEQKEIIRNVERGKVLEGMQAKAAAKRKRAQGADGEEQSVGQDAAAEDSRTRQESRRRFKQMELARKNRPGEQQSQPQEHVQRVLSKIF